MTLGSHRRPSARSTCCVWAQDWSNQEIAYRLMLAESTITNGLSNLFEKLDVNDRTRAASYALSHGLVTGREPQPSEEAGPGATGARQRNRSTHLRQLGSGAC